ncbi:MAG: hypothetical protein ABJA37_13485 [Ferruginibacter sp.]
MRKNEVGPKIKTLRSSAFFFIGVKENGLPAGNIRIDSGFGCLAKY